MSSLDENSLISSNTSPSGANDKRTPTRQSSIPTSPCKRRIETKRVTRLKNHKKSHLPHLGDLIFLDLVKKLTTVQFGILNGETDFFRRHAT